MTEASDTSAESGASVSGLPHAGDKSFATLDAYLAYLKTRGTYGVPFYEETEPGLYRLVTGRRPPGAPPEVTCTRDQLKKMFGFTE